MSTKSCLALIAIVVGIVGCLPTIEVKMKTTVAPDGSTVRETTLHKIRDPGESNDDPNSPHRRPIGKDFPEHFGAEFPGRTETADDIHLSGTFSNPQAVPADFARAVEVVNGISRSRISFKTEDILFGTRYLYRERFADAIEPEDVATARDELIDQCVRFVRAAVRNEFGRGFDVSAFDTYATNDLRPLLVDLLEIFYNERRWFAVKDPHTGKTGFDRMQERVFKRFERFGIDFDEPLDAPLNRLLLENFLADILAQKLKRRGEGPPPKVEDFKYLFPENEPWSGLNAWMERTAIAEYGSTEAAEKSFERALIAVTGSYGSAEATYKFDCSVAMPGLLLRTNGVLEGDNSAFFVFEGEDLFPKGVTLELESVVLDTQRVGRIRELRSNLDRRDAMWLIRALEDVSTERRKEISDLLDRCASFGSLEFLKSGPIDPNDERVKKLLELVAPLRK